jgi:hypothetical protein
MGASTVTQAQANYLQTKSKAIEAFEEQWDAMQYQPVVPPESQKQVLQAGFVLGWIAFYTETFGK